MVFRYEPTSLSPRFQLVLLMTLKVKLHGQNQKSPAAISGENHNPPPTILVAQIGFRVSWLPQGRPFCNFIFAVLREIENRRAHKVGP